MMKSFLFIIFGYTAWIVPGYCDLYPELDSSKEEAIFDSTYEDVKTDETQEFLKVYQR